MSAFVMSALMTTASFAGQLPAQPSVKAITHVAVIPMEDTNQVLTDQTIVVRGNRIVALGPAAQVPVPKGALQVDGRGKYLIPGLADMHTHVGLNGNATRALIERELFLFVANGITTIRNVNYLDYSPDTAVLSARRRAAAGAIWSPRIYASAVWRPIEMAEQGVSIMAALRAYQAAGYDFIKLHGENGALLDSIATAAHLLGIPFMGHVERPNFQDESSTALYHALEVHYASIEHLTSYPGDNWSAKLGADTVELAAEVAATVRAGVWNVPTQVLHELWDVAPTTWPEERYGFPVTLSTRRFAFDNLSYTDSNAVRWNQFRHRIIRALQDAGAGLLLGTDTPLPPVVPGFSAHRELQALVRSGLTPYQALATGTRNVAAYFGTLRDEGTIAVGKRADLVLIDGNPLDNIENTMNPAGVMVNGHWLSRAVIDRRIAPIVPPSPSPARRAKPMPPSRPVP